MNLVSSLFSSSDVLLDLEAPDKHALFEAVGRLWEEQHGIATADVVESLNAREEIGSTGLGEGVAIPHARIMGLTEAIAAFVRPKAPMAFDSPDHRPVDYFFVMLAPAQATEQHLDILANVAEMLSNAQFRDQLGKLQTQEEIYQLFVAWRAQKKRKRA